MQDEQVAQLPRQFLARWLVDPGGDVPADIRIQLITGLYGSSAALTGAVLNSAVVACVIALRIPTPPFVICAALLILLAAARLYVQFAGQSALRKGEPARTDAYVALAVIWAATVGFGTFISVAGGDWVVATLACLSTSAMVGGICFRNFGAPRLVATLILLSFAPCAVAAVASGERIMLLVGFQLPFYLFAMAAASFNLNKLMIRTMCAERLNDHNARHDELTGVMNRAGLSQWVNGVLNGRRARESAFALFYLDLDGFKQVNDTLGHAAGDLVLQTVAERLKGLIRSSDVVARMGGDEFVIVSVGADEAAARHVAERIIQAITEGPFPVGAEAAEIGASVGVALFPDHGTDLESLFEAADRALYDAKAAPGPCYVIPAAPEASEAPAHADPQLLRRVA